MLLYSTQLPDKSTFFSPRLISAIIAVWSRLFVARAASGPIFAIVGLPPVHSICTSRSRSNAAVAHEVTSYPADNRALDTTARPRISWKSETKGGKTK